MPTVLFDLGGGAYNGISPIQTITNQKDSSDVTSRRIVRDSWNRYILKQVNGHPRVTTPFRAAENSGDFLGRLYYSCGGPNPSNANKPGYGRLIGSVPQNCDGTGIPASTCNTRFVADSSDYTRFKKLRAMNQNYNDSSFGGDEHNASYVPMMAIRRY
jgi:hypothetical protein